MLICLILYIYNFMFKADLNEYPGYHRIIFFEYGVASFGYPFTGLPVDISINNF